MVLPGTPNERIGDLRSGMELSQKQLAEIIGIAPSQLSRIENGEIKSISSDILVKLAKALHVSTDYILGLTTISVPKSYDISELGLSEGAVKTLLAVKADMPVLNRLLEHKHFPYLVYLMKSYFTDSIAAGVAGLNNTIDMATATLGDFVDEHPEHKVEVRKQSRFFKSRKLGAHDAEIEKIKAVFLSILKDIKKELAEENAPDKIATADFMKKIQQEILSLPPEDRTPEKAADALVRMVEQATPLNDKTKVMYRKLAMGMFKDFGAEDTENKE